MSQATRPHASESRRRYGIAASGGVGGLALLMLSQSTAGNQSRTTIETAFLVLGVGLWAFSLRFVPPRLDGRRPIAPKRVAHSTGRSVAVALAIGASCLTWRCCSDGVYTRWNVLTWTLAIALWLCAFAPHSIRIERALADRSRDVWVVVAVLAVIVVGVFFRFHDLSGVPAEPTSDHAEKLLDVEEVLGGAHPIFFPRNTGREPLQFYVSAGLVRLGAEPTFGMLKAGTAFVGLVAVLGVLLLGQELAGRFAGLLAASLFAVSAWPVSLARDGLRHTYAITASAFALWLLFRYLRTRSRWDLLACGVVLGIGLHGYTAFRVVPPFVVAVLAVSLIRRPRAMLAESAILIGTIAVTILPLARYALDRPDLVWFRTLRRVGGSEAPIGSASHVVDTVATNVWNAALSFTWRGESGSVALVSYEPFLDVATAAAFLAGLVVLGLWLARGADSRLWALAAALPVLSLSSILNLSFPQENPSAARMGPVVPVVFVIASFSLAYIVQLARGLEGGVRRAAVATAAASVMGVALVANYTAFFRDFDRQYRAFVPNTTEAVAALRRTDVPRERLFLVPYAHWIDPRNVGAELGSVTWGLSNVVEPETPLPAARGQPFAFVLHVNDVAGPARLVAAYPLGSSTLIRSDVGKDFVLFVVSA